MKGSYVNAKATDSEFIKAINYAGRTSNVAVMGRISFAAQKTWINNNRPVFAKIQCGTSSNNHGIVISDYSISDSQLKMIDPASSGGIYWRAYSALSNGTNLPSGSNGKNVKTFYHA